MKNTTRTKVKTKIVNQYGIDENGELHEERYATLQNNGNIDVGWVKLFIENFYDVATSLHSKKFATLTYLIYIRDKNNRVIMTQDDIAKELGISKQTVSRTIKILKDANAIKVKPSIIMINPQVVFYGTNPARAKCIDLYNKM